MSGSTIGTWPNSRAKLEAAGLPSQVAEVAGTAYQSALDASDPLADNAVYVSLHDGVWTIGDNYERVGMFLTYTEATDTWATGISWGDGLTPMPGGLNEAHSNASLFYHG